MRAATSRTCGTRLSAEASSPSGRRVSLKVLPPPLKRSTMSRRRAAVLLLVHLAIAAHIVQWLVSGMSDGVRETLSPVEPSEAMYTLEQGLVNAGFVVFVLAIVSTLVLGRWFCGWACHVVALQDLCGWMMKKLGVHPKPFRTRLVVLAPMVLALYMFVWPTVRRWLQSATDLPEWLGRTGPFPGFSAHFIIEDFWRTFPPWYVAVPFLMVCGFATVYFLGNKGFCTYGCPYGGFFGPADRLSPGRIVVSDACEGCGHCTATCSSNVRVHEEVRDFGMVVDPGCMKCMDCVSVCPNGALSFGFATPPAFARPRTAEAAARRAKPSPLYDLTWREEVWVGLVFLGLVIATRGMLGLVPLLMAMGLASIGAFAVWKLACMIREPNVRLGRLQLRLKGRVTRAGWAHAALTASFVLAAGWSAHTRWHLWRGELAHHRLGATIERVLAPGYVPAEADLANARLAAAHFERAGAPSQGGVGWRRGAGTDIKLSWARAVAGQTQDAVGPLRDAVLAEPPGHELLEDYTRLLAVAGRTPAQAEAALREVDERHGGWAPARVILAGFLLGQGRRQEAFETAAWAATRRGAKPSVIARAVRVMVVAGASLPSEPMLRRAEEAAAAAVAARPRSAELRTAHATALWYLGREPDAFAALRTAIEIEPRNSAAMRQLAELLSAADAGPDAAAHRNEAAELLRRAAELDASRSAPSAASGADAPMPTHR